MTIKKALQRSYYLMAILPVLFLVFTILSVRFFIVDRVVTKQEERIEILSLVIPFILLALITLILIIMMVNLIITRKQIERITLPLKQLEQQTKLIIDGDLQTPITYESDDEFTRVFHAFDEMRKQLLTSIDARTHLENNRSMFLSGLTHDILTPLTAIRGYIEALQDNIAQTPSQQERYLSIIQQKSKSIEQLVEKLTLINQFQETSNGISLNRTTTHTLCHKIEQLFETEYPSLSWHLNNQTPKDTFFYGDTTELIRVFTNLIENSIKYAEVDPLQLRITAYVTQTSCIFQFHNNGKEIDPEQLPQLFTPFFRGDAARTNTINGSGLGLAICKQIITAHNGKISAENKHGFQVTFEIPRIMEDAYARFSY